jgi:4'-phosphopantetheinyl transferase
MDNALITVFCTDLPAVTWQAAVDWKYAVFSATDIWRVSLSANHHWVQQLHDILNSDEQVRAGKYLRGEDAKRFIICRAALKLLLGKYAAQPVSTIALQYGSNRKPFLQTVRGDKLHFNVTHSGDLALIAISHEEVGIDIEQMKSNFEYLEVLDNYFSLREIKKIKDSTEPLKLFYKLWTRKEALLKATGKGIIDELSAIEVLDGDNEVDAKLIGTKCNWMINSFNNQGYAVSLSTHNYPVNFWDINLRNLNA